jgi:MYXO-CTERM domain-containing protein
MQGLFDIYIDANTQNFGNHNSVANGASFATSANGGAAYAGVSNALGGYAGKIGNFGGDTNGLIGTNLSVWNIVRNGTNNLTTATATKLNIAGFNPYFNLSNTGALTYVAAVPEADSWAMLLAGLGLMGFIARRRTLGGLV